MTGYHETNDTFSHTHTLCSYPPLRAVTSQVVPLQPAHLNICADLLPSSLHRLGLRIRSTASEPLRDGRGDGENKRVERPRRRCLSHGFLRRWDTLGRVQDNRILRIVTIHTQVPYEYMLAC